MRTISMVEGSGETPKEGGQESFGLLSGPDPGAFTFSSTSLGPRGHFWAIL